MKITNSQLLLIILIAVISIAIISNIIIRWLFSSPGGSVYIIGFPITYRTEYCGGYAPCYWGSLSQINLIGNVLFWLVIIAIILFVVKYRKGRKKN